MGRIAAIWIKRAHRGPMDPVEQVAARAGVGLEGNADQGGKRQVTLLDAARWRDAEAELGARVPHEARRANVLTEGIDYLESRGRVLSLGGVRVRIGGNTRPCERMDEAHAGLRAALGPDGELLDDGVLATGDAAEWVEEAP